MNLKVPTMKYILMMSLLLLALRAQTATAARDFKNILEATEQMLAGRTFEGEDGVVLSFSKFSFEKPHEPSMQVEISSPGGNSKSHKEIIRKDGEQVVVDEIQQGSIVNSFLASVEEPYHVLRIRPLDETNSELISRECFLQTNESIHICYFKFRTNNAVFVTVFREIPHS